jgi:thiosulfate/3-mercaptopyruvate sulfurtransferase
VVYDDEGGGWAGRFIWTLDIIGHKNYSYLNGGLHAWLAAAYSIDNTPVSVAPSKLTLQLHSHAQALMSEVLAHYQDTAHYVLWDARSIEEYNGSRLLAMRGGHIPHAVHYEWTNVTNKDNSLKLRPLAIIQQELATLGIDNSKTVITYCQTHHRSGLKLFGRKAVRL